MAKASEACAFLKRCPSLTLGSMLEEIATILPGHEFASVRAGVEMAIIDAVVNSIRVPLWRLFGGSSNTITTDITHVTDSSRKETLVHITVSCENGAH
ncbi:L-Ala-D/L-amino acid epimerase-like [Arachis hypogaea]|uniref:L-Ala-D/L-amino acid epimerase-like n=1 Tax=Arachis hypogaea TaxID=3818 RepID=UPI003B21A982